MELEEEGPREAGGSTRSPHAIQPEPAGTDGRLAEPTRLQGQSPRHPRNAFGAKEVILTWAAGTPETKQRASRNT